MQRLKIHVFAVGDFFGFWSQICHWIFTRVLGNWPQSVGLPSSIRASLQKCTTSDRWICYHQWVIFGHYIHKSSGTCSVSVVTRPEKYKVTKYYFFGAFRYKAFFTTSFKETIANLSFGGNFCFFKLNDFLNLGSGSTFSFSIAEPSHCLSTVEMLPKPTAHV